MNGFIAGTDAIEVAKISGVQLSRAPCRKGEDPDTNWRTAELCIAMGDAVADDFYIDLDSLPVQDAGTVILCLVGMCKAILDYGMVLAPQ